MTPLEKEEVRYDTMIEVLLECAGWDEWMERLADMIRESRDKRDVLRGEAHKQPERRNP